MIDRADRPARILAALLFLLLALVIARTAWISDDAYITFRTVDNFVHGYGLRWNVAERVQAYTHPLWMLLVAAVYAVTREVYFSVLALSIGLSLAAVALLVTRVASSAAAAVVGIVVLVSSKAFVDYSTSGLESPLTHLLLLAFVVRAAADERSPRKVFDLWLIASLAMLNRPDVVLLLVPALAAISWSVGRRSLVPAVLGLTPFLAWELFSLAYYGFLVPNTAYAKLHTGLERGELLQQGFYYLLDSLNVDPITLGAIAAGCTASAAGRSRTGWLLPTGVLLYLAYVVRIGGDFMSGRFLTPAFVLSVAAIVRLPWAGSGALWPTVSVLVAAVGLSGTHPPILSGADYGGRRPDSVGPAGVTDERNIYYSATGLLARSRAHPAPDHRRYFEGLEAREQGPHVVNMSAIGFYGFAAGPDVHVVDMLALADPLLARLPARRPWQIGHYYRRIPDGYMETLQSGASRFSDPGVAAYYAKLQLITRWPLWTRERWDAIVGMNTGRYDALVGEYGRTRVSIASLQDVKPDGTPDNAPGTVPILERGLIVDLGRVVDHGTIEMSLDRSDEFRVQLLKDGRVASTAWVRPLPQGEGGGLATRRVRIPSGASADHVSILPMQGDHTYSLGHLRIVEPKAQSPKP
jgi:arabinofuranosyltransferase